MKTYVWKNPSPDTLAKVQQLDDKAPAPGAPYELMTNDDFVIWQKAQLAAGWVADFSGKQIPPQPPSIEDRLAQLEADVAALKSGKS